MNAHALLTAQGWRGTGHSLHPTNDDTGLKHHLLIKRNEGGCGLGSKKDHKQEAWWLNAFDQALKGIDTKSGTMKQTLRGGALEKITAKGAAEKYTGTRGLYSSFVKGGMMEGTVGVSLVTGLPTPPESGVGTPVASGANSTDGDEKGVRKETKEEGRARREAKRLRKAEKQAKKEAKERTARKVEKKAKKAERQHIKVGETKEERRARRDARRSRKEEKRRLKSKSGG